MHFIITKNDVVTSNGFTSSIATAFRYKYPGFSDIQVNGTRISAKRDGYPVRFLLSGFSPSVYRDLMYGTIQAASCTLKAVAVPMTQTSKA